MKFLELAVLEAVPGPKTLLAVFLPQRRSYLTNSSQPFYCRDAVLQHHVNRCLNLNCITISALTMKLRSNAQIVTPRKVNEACCWLSQRRWSIAVSLKLA